jgi:hemoglobin/transferrin/lactoferrin receptor protein
MKLFKLITIFAMQFLAGMPAWNALHFLVRQQVAFLNKYGEDNPQYAAPNGYVPGSVIPDGFPSWIIINLRASLELPKSITLQAGVENIFGRNYRYFASGFSAAGRNLILAARVSF